MTTKRLAELDQRDHQLFLLYVAGNGAKSVAQALNERGLLYRRDKPCSKDLVLHVLDEPAVAGTY